VRGPAHENDRRLGVPHDGHDDGRAQHRYFAVSVLTKNATTERSNVT
jgi:hypothetical protein